MSAEKSTDRSFSMSTMPSEASTAVDSEKGEGTVAEGQRPKRWHWFSKTDSSADAERNEHMPITRTLDQCPMGYSRLATFLSSDRSFMQYRGFGSLRSRMLLAQQYDIEVLEKELDTIDLWEASEGMASKLRCKDRDDRDCCKSDMPATFPHPRTRPEILMDLKEQLMCYDTMLLNAKQVASMQHPAERDWRSVKRWIMGNKPLVDEEQEFILRKEDLVTLRPGREGAGFESVVERMLRRVDKFLTQRLRCEIIKHVFMTPELRKKTSDIHVHYYAPERVDKLVNAIITAVIFVLLVLPVVAMYELSNVSQSASPFEAIGILIVFTLVFGMAMSSLTKATRQELFAASAAYCAVLVVFISNFSTQTVEIAT